MTPVDKTTRWLNVVAGVGGSVHATAGAFRCHRVNRVGGALLHMRTAEVGQVGPVRLVDFPPFLTPHLETFRRPKLAEGKLQSEREPPCRRDLLG